MKTYSKVLLLAFQASVILFSSCSKDAVEAKKSYSSTNAAARRETPSETFFYSEPGQYYYKECLSKGIFLDYPELTFAEATAIRCYTSTAKLGAASGNMRVHRYLNQLLLSPTNKENLTTRPFFGGLNTLLRSGLAKLNNRAEAQERRTFYRSVGGAEATIAKAWKAGQKITFNSFKSTSVSPDVALNYSAYQNSDVIFIINAKNNDVSAIAVLPEELESIFLPGTVLNVTNTRKQYRPDLGREFTYISMVKP